MILTILSALFLLVIVSLLVLVAIGEWCGNQYKHWGSRVVLTLTGVGGTVVTLGQIAFFIAVFCALVKYLVGNII